MFPPLVPRRLGSKATQAAVFLDRDGVLNKLVEDPRTGKFESPYKAADLSLTKDAVKALEILKAAGFKLVVVSNQPGAAKMNATREGLAAVHARFAELVEPSSRLIDDYRYCYHHPDGLDPELTCRCECRKPAPGMLHAAAADLSISLIDSWMIGDSDVDIEAGKRAGCKTVLIENPDSRHRRSCNSIGPTYTATSAIEAAKQIVTSAKDITR